MTITDRRAATASAAYALFFLFLFGSLAVAVTTGATAELDALLREGVHRLSSPTATAIMSAVTDLGSVWVIGGLSVVGFIGFWILDQRRNALTLAIVMAGEVALESGLKYAFHRARPDPFFGLATPETYSFPSGHALASACFYIVVANLIAQRANNRLMSAILRIAALGLVAAVGLSRVYLGVHYPSDVLGGYFVAGFWLNVVAGALHFFPQRQLQAS